jgi:DNA-binding CsgD family transcriptional regulator
MATKPMTNQPVSMTSGVSAQPITPIPSVEVYQARCRKVLNTPCTARELIKVSKRLVTSINMSDITIVPVIDGRVILTTALSTWPEPLLAQYHVNDYSREDQGLKYLSDEQAQPVFYDCLYQHLRNSPTPTMYDQHNIALHRLLHRFGYHNVYAMGFNCLRNGVRIIVLFGRVNTPAAVVQQHIDNAIKQIHVLGQQLANWYNDSTLLTSHISDSRLTPVEKLVLTGIINDLTQSEIAKQRGVSVRTVSTQVESIKNTVQTKTSAGAACKAIKKGWI